MRAPRPARDHQRGNSLLLALIVMSSLATLGSLTVVSVQSSLKASTNDRSQTVAMYAAESGGAAAMEFLRNTSHFDLTLGWSAYVLPNGQLRALSNLTELPSNGAPPGDSRNLFSLDLNAFFVVELINNRSDLHYAQISPASENDDDGIVIIRSTGHGPQGSLAVIEWEVQRIPDPKPWNAGMLTKALIIRSWRTVL